MESQLEDGCKKVHRDARPVHQISCREKTTKDGGTKQLDQLYYMLFVGERKVAMGGVDTENSLSVLKDRIKHKESEKTSVHRIRVSKWKRYAMPLAAFLCGLLVSVGAI